MREHVTLGVLGTWSAAFAAYALLEGWPHILTASLVGLAYLSMYPAYPPARHIAEPKTKSEINIEEAL